MREPIRVVVVGAGPAGLAIAHGLTARGHHVRVVEQAPALRVGGAAVTIWPNGFAALSALGIEPSGLGQRLDALESRTSRGARLWRISHRTGTLGECTLSVPRAELVHRLVAALRVGTLCFASECVSVTQLPGDLARVVLGDGRTLDADLVIGADGHNSVLRRQLWPDPSTRPTGWVTWQGLSEVPIDLTASTLALTMLGPEGFCGFQPAGRGRLQWWFDAPPAAGALSSAHPVDGLRKRFGSWASPVPEVLATIEDGDVGCWPHYTHRVPDIWGAGPCTLLGDAAHTMPPSLGQGLNQTLNDALALCRAVDDAGSLPPALRRYEALRARQIRPIARLAGSEASITYRRSTQLLMRVIPDQLAAAAFHRLLRRSSVTEGDRVSTET